MCVITAEDSFMQSNNKQGETFLVFIDGASIGNPGPSGIGVVITDKTRVVLKVISRFIGKKTNNQAEYMALITALKSLEDMKIKADKVIIHTDSELLYNQIKGRFKVRNPNLKELYKKVETLLNGIKIELRKVPRNIEPEMKAADRLAKKAAQGGKEV